MIVKKEVDFYDIIKDAWGDAIFTLETIEDEDKEKEFMALLEELYPEGVDETELNNFIAFEDDFIFFYLGIPSEDDDDDDE